MAEMMHTDATGPGEAATLPRPPTWPASRATLTDEQLLPHLKAGDGAAYEEILRRYETKIFSLARGLTRNDQDAEDVLQEACLSIFKNICKFKGESSLSTWIYRITVNAGLMKVRGRKKDERSVPIEEYMPKFDETGHRVAVVPDWHPAVDELLLNKELAGLLRRWIAELEPDYRVVFVLRDQEGLSNEEVAAALDLSVPAVKSRLHRARLYLRERAKRYVYQGGKD